MTTSLCAIGFVILPLLFFPVFLCLSLLASVFWIWMLIDCAMNEPNEGTSKIVWILIILFTHFLGAGIYFLARRPERMRQLGK